VIFVTTAGKVGSEAVRLLRGRDVPVRVLVRDPAKVTALAEAGAEVAEGDLGVPAGVDDAMAGVSAVVLVSPAVPAQELNVVRSATRAGVGHVVKATSKASADSPIARRRWQAEIEAGLAASGIPAHAAAVQRLHAERAGAGPGDREDEQLRVLGRPGPLWPDRRPATSQPWPSRSPPPPPGMPAGLTGSPVPG
jgi:nucleoside-diphosphate-sugar epimerase